MKNYLKKIFNTRKSSAGFTLTELLIAAAITSVAVGAAGWGLVNIIGINRTANAQTERRTELNRALDFMAEEVRQAESINRIAAPAASQPSSSTVATSTVQSILVLEIPNVAQPVVYHIAQPNGTPWQGPRGIYRWGPNMNGDGTYSDPVNSAGWQNQLLVDLVEASQPNPNPACPNGWTSNPTNSTDRRGFYACVDPTRRIARIHLAGRINKAYGSPDVYPVSTRAYARNLASTFNFANNNGGAPTGVIIPKWPSTVNFRILGSSITCGAGGVTIPVTTHVEIRNAAGNLVEYVQINANQPFTRDVDAGFRIRVVGTALSSSVGCGGNLTYGSDTSQAVVLRDGEEPPTGYTPFDNQTSIEEYVDEFVNDADGTVQIGSNQAIYFFELGSTNPSSSAFDMQDLVVLGTVDPRD